MQPNATITCPACGAPMTERANRQTLSRFMGCTRYPECSETAKVPAWLEVIRAGGTPLPGMEP